MTKVFTAGSRGVAGEVQPGFAGCVGPRNGGAEFGYVREDGRLHDFEVLLVLVSSANCHLVEPLAGMRLVNAAEATEGGEEVVVSADASAGNEAAHGKRIYKGVVEVLVLEGVL